MTSKKDNSVKRTAMWCCTFVVIVALCWTSCADAPDQSRVAEGGVELPWETGIALFSFHRHPFPTALEMADSAAVKYVEGFSFYQMGGVFGDQTMGTLDQPGRNRLKDMLKERNIAMSSMYVDGAENAEDWKQFFELGRELDLKYLVSEPKKEHWDLIDSLAGLYNIPVAIHEHARGLSAYWHPDSVLAAIQGRKHIGVCADLGHWARSGLDPVQCLQQLEGHILGVHLKDVDEFDNVKAKDVNPGEGVIDFAAVIKELKRQGFNGFMHVECEHHLDHNLPYVKEAIRYIADLMEER